MLPKWGSMHFPHQDATHPRALICAGRQHYIALTACLSSAVVQHRSLQRATCDPVKEKHWKINARVTQALPFFSIRHRSFIMGVPHLLSNCDTKYLRSDPEQVLQSPFGNRRLSSSCVRLIYIWNVFCCTLIGFSFECEWQSVSSAPAPHQSWLRTVLNSVKNEWPCCTIKDTSEKIRFSEPKFTFDPCCIPLAGIAGQPCNLRGSCNWESLINKK